MAPNLSPRVKNQLRAVWKLFLSVRTRDWKLDDYPVVIREQEADPAYDGTRLKQYRYVASIVKWGLVGLGDSEEESLQKLESSFAAAKAERARTRRPPPRPGTRVPIEFASQERVSAHPELAEDFIRRVLELECAWISDESSLWDFHHDETNDILLAKVMEVYGLDVSDIESARLSEILERIASVQKARC
jgi:hypothetical protein